MNLSSKERAFLKKITHGLEPVVRIGKDGIDDNVIESMASVVKKRELIKVKVLQNSDVEIGRELGNELAFRTKSFFVDSIGKIMIFFKPNNKDGKITKDFNEFKKKGKK
ncbi:YhbY family RNA-binding protein [Leptotrichia sp. OH3620_COT-345]|uniref:YhbY family RNA-binding protein n=1 Tax=Leptotrichia sp. OH3620_COT-345 TaxID=2491048 RepID=UPI000F64DAEA|nr:YhbY family RNA-binding protein [Leptotrichia sp. OH3620_COT-345]RRD40660.1 YhbY family RNA-binding protein [Leptotrichia sp. OH3620_COT-345]